MSSMSHVRPPQLRSGSHMRSMCLCHFIDPREASLGKSDDDMWTAKDRWADLWSKPTQNLIHIEDVPWAHMSASWRKERTIWPRRGSAQPTYGRLIMTFHVVVAHWSKAAFPGCFRYSPAPLPVYKWKKPFSLLEHTTLLLFSHLWFQG
jgi:hypothetical protein